MFAEGQYSHSLGLYRFGERWYDAKLRRWTQQDPLQQPFDPRNANAYIYAGQDPVNFADPSGEVIPALIAGASVVARVAPMVVRSVQAARAASAGTRISRARTYVGVGAKAVKKTGVRRTEE